MLALDEEVRSLGVRADELRRRSKELSAQVGKALKAGQAADVDKEAVRRMRDELEGLEATGRALEAERSALELTFENLLLPQVETGRSSDDNVVMRTWGEPPSLDFIPRAHDEIGEALGILD